MQLKQILCSISETCNFSQHPNVIFLNTGDIFDGKILHNNYSESKFLPGQAKKTIKNQDILFSEIRPANKRFALVCVEDPQNYVVSTKLMVLRCYNSNYSVDYVYSFLTQPSLLSKLQTLAESRSGTFPQITFSEIANLEIPEFSLAEQRHIVDILGTLDEKIEYYDKLINSLEQNGELIFKDFIENKSLLKKHICLSDIATFYNGYSYSGDELCEQSEEALVTIKNFDRNGGFKIEGLKPIKITGKIKPTMFVELGDLLVAHTDLTQNADIIGNPIILLNLGNYKKAAISMDLVKVESSKLSKELLYYILKNSDFKAHALGYCSGTTVLHLNKKALQEYEFDLPLNDSTIEKVNNKLKTIFDRIQIAFLERQKLTELKQLYLQKFFG